MSRWSWTSKDGRSQSEQQQHLRNEQAKNARRDDAAKRQAEQNKSKGRDIPQKGKQ